ncbi:MAG TPA: hypothetical protein VIJ28_05020 [Chloroflexota bacterium]
MRTQNVTRSFRRHLLVPTAILAPAALLAAAIVPALNAPSHAAPASAAPRSITIRASAAAFPKKIAAGFVSVTLVNDSKGTAEASFARATPGATLAQIKAANAGAQTVAGFVRLTQLLTFLGGDNTIPAGATETAVLDLRVPGLYGVDLTIGNGPNRLLTFTVTPGAGSMAARSNGIPVSLKDMKILGLPKQIGAGAVSFQFTNNGPQVHEMSLVKLDAGKIQKDVLTMLRSPQGRNGPPPAWAHDMGGMDVLSPHQVANLQLTLSPGYYVAMCFMPDVKKQGQPHVMEGMITHFIVQ